MKYKLSFANGKPELFKESGLSYGPLDYESIYQCSIWHNIVPFSINPQDKSYCGISYGKSTGVEEFTQVNNVTL